VSELGKEGREEAGLKINVTSLMIAFNQIIYEILPASARLTFFALLSFGWLRNLR